MSPAGVRLFASRQLAARIERAECELLAAGVRATRRRSPEVQVLEQPVAGGLATWNGPDSPLDKVAGLGFDGAVAGADLAAVEEAFARRGSPVQVEVSALGDPAVLEVLNDRGYRLVGFENVLGMALPARRGPEVAPGIEVASSAEDEIDAWLDAVVGGFCHPDEQGTPSHESFSEEILRSAIGDMAAADGFLRYAARRRGEIAGGAGMRLSGTVAQLCGAATLPAHRRRGVQSSLLARRLADGAAAGCEIAVVTTQPGSKSQENVQKLGFEVLYARAVLVRDVGDGSADSR